MREVELKSVVDDLDAAREKVETAGGKLEFEGKLVDVRYGDPTGALLSTDQVLRLRVYESEGKSEGHLDWKGPTRLEDGYKVREELSTTVGDPVVLREILARVGYSILQVIERDIAQYSVAEAMVRFERYPRMDTLVEVEGSPEAIEAAIASLGLPRQGFTSGRLADFVADYETRTGKRAAVSDAEQKTAPDIPIETGEE